MWKVCLFGLRLNVPVNNFSVMSERSHRFLGITSTFFFFLGGGGGVNVSCSRIQHGDPSYMEMIYTERQKSYPTFSFNFFWIKIDDFKKPMFFTMTVQKTKNESL